MWLLVGVAAGACPEDPAQAVRSRATELEAAYDAVDEDAFAVARDALQADAACLTAPIDRDTAVAWHRARALGAFFEREEIASARSFAAVKALDPSWTPPEAWIVPGTPLHRAWTEAPSSDARSTLERAPAGGWFVDGQPEASVPTERAFVLQGFDADGGVVHTAYHYSLAEVPQVDFEALDGTVRERRRKRMRVGGSVLGGVLAAGAIGTLGVAFTEERAVKSDATALEEVPGHAQRANQLSGVGLGLAAGSLGVTTVAWGVRW